MKFMCRESLDYGRSSFDHPLGSRFEEMDAVVFFDNVFVPWERVFLLGDVEMANKFAAATQSTSHTGHQVVNRTVVKTEFLLGLTSLMCETLGSTQVPHVQERIGEIIVNLEMLKACVRAAEADAQLNEWGMMCPSFGPLTAARTVFANSMYPRMAEIVQLLGSSSLMVLPAESDFHSEIAPELERYLATETAGAKDRVRLFHLAWDVACSAFGGRQILYERFFGGDPVRNTMLLYQGYDKTNAMDRVQRFLEREG
jgi:4-hydroxyphenylacetate 3-monooxygenase